MLKKFWLSVLGEEEGSVKLSWQFHAIMYEDFQRSSDRVVRISSIAQSIR